MPWIGDELKTYFKTIGAITSIVGSGTAARIFETDAPEKGATRYIVFEVFPGLRFRHLTAASGLARNRIQIDAYGGTRTEAFDLADAIRLAPFESQDHFTMGSTHVSEVIAGAYESGKILKSEGSSVNRYWISCDYIVTYAEATVTTPPAD